MSKPELRAEMEIDFEAICQGRKTREQVLRTQIAKYTSAFSALERGAIKLEDAIRKYFGINSQTGSTHGSNDGSSFDSSSNVSQQSEAVMKCNRCSSVMYLKQNRRRSHPESQNSSQNPFWEIVCDGFPSCNASINIPNFATSVEVSRTKCLRCSVPSSDSELPKLLEFRFKPNSVPPYFGLEYSGCLAGCNLDLLNLFRETSNSGNPNRSGNVISSLGSSHFSAASSAANMSRESERTSNSFNRGSNINSRNQGRTVTSRVRASANQNRSRGQSTSSFRNSSTPRRGSRGSAMSRGSRGSRTPSGPYRGASTSSWNQSQQGPGSNVITRDYSTNGSQPTPGVVPTMNCLCEQQVVERTVRKEGPNQGRLFYSCASRGCNFFLWATDNPN